MLKLSLYGNETTDRIYIVELTPMAIVYAAYQTERVCRKSRKLLRIGFQRVYSPFGGVRRQYLWWGDSPQRGEMSRSDRGDRPIRLGQSPTDILVSASQRVNFKTVQWTALKEGDSLQCMEIPKWQRKVRAPVRCALQVKSSPCENILF